MPVRIRNVALPIEHGAWGFWLEPALLGLLLAPSAAGAALVLAALAALLLQTPLSLALTDMRRGRSYTRTALAWGWALGYGLVLVVAGGAALAWAATAWFLLPVVVAAPLALAQLWYDAHGRAREALPEMLGALAMGSLASVVVLAAGWPLGAAFVPWLVLALRTVPTILYVRVRLRLERGTPVRRAPAVVAHLLSLAAITVIVALTGASAWLLVAFVLLSVRAVAGVSEWRRRVTAKVVGFSELAYGVLLALTVAATLARP